MKNKISKIMGIVLTLAILAGLLVSAMPVSAGTLSWTNAEMPNNKDFQLVAGNTANVYAFAADGKTVFMYDNTGNLLYKSVDGGVKWTNINLGTTLNGVVGDVQNIVVSPNYATDTTLWASSAALLYRSRNGGQTWALDATYGGAGAISSLGAAKWYVSGGNIALMVTTPTQLWVYNDNDNWVNYVALVAAAWPAGCTPIAAAFSPSFQSDALIMVISEDVAGTYFDTRVGNAVWNGTLKRAIFQNKGATGITTAAGGSIAFPSDFNYSTPSMAKAYVGLNGAASATSYDVFRVNMQLQSVPVATFVATNLDLTGTDGAANFNVADVAYTGTAASGTLVASILASNAVYNTVNVASSTPTWTNAMNAPLGNSANLYFVGTTLYAGTLAGFNTSTDYNSFAAISMISVSGLGVGVTSFSQYKILGTDQFILLTDAPALSPEMIFKSTDSGATWKMVYSAVNIAGLSNSPAYATDKTIFAYTSAVAGGDKIYKSSDAGATWFMLNPTSSDLSIRGFSAIDGNSYWFGRTLGGGIYKSGSYTETALLDGTVPFAIMSPPIGMFVATTSGELYYSADSGATFTRLGNAAQFGASAPSCVFDVPGKTVYAVNTTAANAVIWKWTIGTSTSWDQVCTVSTTTPAVANYFVKSMNFTAGVLYVTAIDALVTYAGPVPAAAGVNNFQMLRSVNLTRPAGQQVFDPIPGTQYDPSGFGGFTGSVQLSPIAVTNDKFTGNSVLVSVTTRAGAGPNVASAHVYAFNDILTVAPSTATPTPNAQIPANFNFTWKPITSPQTLTYRYQIATDVDFNGFFVNAVTGSTTTYQAGLTPGNSYWYRVRVETAAGNNMPSPWSAPPVAFKCQLAGDVAQGLNAVDRMTPANGAIGTSLTPTFTWGAVAGSDSYTLQVADNPFFANPVEKKPLTTTIWVWDSALKANTVYYWRVQAVAAGNASTWVANAFTTGTGVAAPAPGATAPAVAPTIIVPTPVVNVSVPAPTSQAAAPETPAYIWVIIAIGAVLVIAVIVLIARTRRSA